MLLRRFIMYYIVISGKTKTHTFLSQIRRKFDIVNNDNNVTGPC